VAIVETPPTPTSAVPAHTAASAPEVSGGVLEKLLLTEAAAPASAMTAPRTRVVAETPTPTLAASTRRSISARVRAASTDAARGETSTPAASSSSCKADSSGTGSSEGGGSSGAGSDGGAGRPCSALGFEVVPSSAACALALWGRVPANTRTHRMPINYRMRTSAVLAQYPENAVA
jgi:hypothetical protein